ncbi:MAG TPA: hypothetical protein VE620_13365 [Myxococcales bacterium]|jgi:hypothetical protein|nr:hypothetical protein [Myxococcales bacterium]
MNWKRIIAGGLAAGALIDVVEGGLSGVLFGGQFQSELVARGLDLKVGPAGAAFFTLWGFVLGFASVWLYAAVRPRLGAGPRTALWVAIAVWLVSGVLPHLRDATLGILSLNLSLKFIALQLAWQIAATLLGAFIYRESSA